MYCFSETRSISAIGQTWNFSSSQIAELTKFFNAKIKMVFCPLDPVLVQFIRTSEVTLIYLNLELIASVFLFLTELLWKVFALFYYKILHIAQMWKKNCCLTFFTLLLCKQITFCSLFHTVCFDTVQVRIFQKIAAFFKRKNTKALWKKIPRKLLLACQYRLT